MVEVNWQIVATSKVPESFSRLVESLTHGKGDRHLAQLLWQREFRDEAQLPGFLDPDAYEPTSPFAFGQEMKWAIQRLMQARNQGEKVAIWGDFDADGVTATSVLWEGLGQFFEREQQLCYHIPNRLTESHGLNQAGIDRLKDWGATLIVTCDTGSTDFAEIAYAKTLGIEFIVTDHHTLPETRPDVVAIINPRYFAETHPLYHLSGVAVAYKLVEALYETLPEIPQQPLHYLLDLVAIGLIADLVALKGDCRYLAQRGIQELHKQSDLATVVHPGIKALLDACRKTGDRPTDISFGIGPRINAVSRIYGDASFCVELLTSRHTGRCGYLAQQTELANARRKELQRKVQHQAQIEADKLDLSTTGVLVLAHPQWQGGVLGLVASHIAQMFGRPAILLTYDRDQDLWKGSARSVQGIDLYELVQDQSHLLHRFGGHPFAAGLSLRPENLELFKMAINQQARQKLGSRLTQRQGNISVDLVVTVEVLGEALFQSLDCLEPFGMGNPKPRLLVKNCGLEVRNCRKLFDKLNRPLNAWKTEFILWDDTGEIPGLFWGRPDDLLQGPGLDVVLELEQRLGSEECYVVNPVAIAPTTEIALAQQSEHLIDLRQQSDPPADNLDYLSQTACPVTWQDLYQPYQRAIALQKPLALCYSLGDFRRPEALFKDLIGLAKYLTEHHQKVAFFRLQEKLACGDRPLKLGLIALETVGFRATIEAGLVHFEVSKATNSPAAFEQFVQAILEEQFQQQYFMTAPLSIIQATLQKAPELPSLS